MNGPASPFLEWSYRIGLLAKGSLGALQLAGGIGMALAPVDAVRGFVGWLTRNEIAEDPTDPLAQLVVNWAAQQTPDSGTFYAFYLLGHGALNLGVVLAL